MAWLVWTIRLLVLTLAVLVGGVFLFNAAVYPPHGLAGFSEQDHDKALLKAAALYAVSTGMSLDQLLERDVRTLGPGKGTFAWGIVALRDRNNMQYRLWVSLQNFGGGWSRASSNVYPDNKSLGLVVDPWDRMLFRKDTEPNMSKTTWELEMLYREQLRRIKEYVDTSM